MKEIINDIDKELYCCFRDEILSKVKKKYHYSEILNILEKRKMNCQILDYLITIFEDGCNILLVINKQDRIILTFSKFPIIRDLKIKRILN